MDAKSLSAGTCHLLVDCWLTEIAVRDLCLFLCVIGEDSSPNWQLPDHRQSSDSCRYTWRCIQRIHSSNLHFWALTKARTSILHESFVDDASNLLLSLNLHNPFHLWTVLSESIRKKSLLPKSHLSSSLAWKPTLEAFSTWKSREWHNPSFQVCRFTIFSRLENIARGLTFS